MELYTIGYEGLTQKTFLALLQSHGISVVADVRYFPFSRKKGFSKNRLNEFLNDQHIEYVHYRELGTSKQMRDELKETGNYKTFFREFQRSIADKNEQLDEIYSMLLSGEKVTLLCFERNPQICHRTIIADEVKKKNGNGLRVKHISPE